MSTTCPSAVHPMQTLPGPGEQPVHDRRRCLSITRSSRVHAGSNALGMVTRIAFDDEFAHALRVRGLTLTELASRARVTVATASSAVHGDRSTSRRPHAWPARLLRYLWCPSSRRGLVPQQPDFGRSCDQPRSPSPPRHRRTAAEARGAWMRSERRTRSSCPWTGRGEREKGLEPSTSSLEELRC